ncbi:zinc finger CCCH domain-containing protein 3-like isoform X1 [Amphibalanus amphitrite]|uniref:zinc finger CCCH domain-containing protein 3-like isoform X1 n=1 Tax=Amphibalanus amphitrite TaxID=1232801 RepID=UPI001C8FB6FE|nr:zinc finger CCCH domain-containing protein 3-like isoform X1 [Amphibalanus amphitrite]
MNGFTMASSNEKVLLKQITDLTRQIENQKRGFDRYQHKSKSKNFTKPWAKKSSTTFYSNHVHVNKAARSWQKPTVFNKVADQSEKLNHSKLVLKVSKTKQQHPLEGSSSVSGNAVQKPSQEPSQVFVNPNFVPAKVGVTVHINPKFQSQTPAVTVKVGSSGSLAGPSSAGPVSAAIHTPLPGVVLSSVPGAVPPITTSSVPSAGPSAPSLGPSVPSVGPSAPFAGPSAVPAPGGRTRRRSLSRYRLLTARKLVRRRSREAAPHPTGHRAAVSPRPLSARKLVSTRHKLVRVVSTPRTQQLVGRHTANGAGTRSWSPSVPSGRPAVSSRYRLVRSTPAAAAAMAVRPVLSQHRTWRRKSITATPTARLTSAGSLRLGSTRFVNIGGLLYKTTARKLQRAVPKSTQKNGAAATGSSARSPGWISVRGARFRVEAGGRSLRRVDRGTPAPPRLDIGGVTFRPAADGTLTADSRRQTSRTVISRAKSRSLAVLRGPLRLSRQPCRFFCRLGRCRRYERDQCPHVHDPALRPVCTRHLQEGGCRRPGCAYNHAPRPEKVPHCLHFLTSECRRENCPYQHVNVDADAPLCTKFLAGFCARGQLCTDKHLYICPEFGEKGECPRGTSCPLAHRARRHRRRSQSASTAPARPLPETTPVAPPRGRGRYYLGDRPQPSAAESDSETEEEEEVEGERRPRPPMAEMPSFIAIADSSDEE